MNMIRRLVSPFAIAELSLDKTQFVIELVFFIIFFLKMNVELLAEMVHFGKYRIRHNIGAPIHFLHFPSSARP